jgi:ABC-2 type transport system ATP-binding protein
MIETLNLSKHFGPIRAVNDLNFSVEKGEVLGFLGPNGAGKSTTMKMLTCFITPSAGTARVCGHDIRTDQLNVKRALGYLPESAPAYSEMTVLGFLNFCASMRGMSGEAHKKAVGRVMDMTQLESVRHQTFETLSKGYKRRTCLAQALIHDPAVLIMDEPTDGLDPNQKHEVRSLIKRMASEKCIILSTHILEEVEAVCSRAVVIASGRLVADGTPEELMRKSRWHGAVTLTLKTGNGAQEALKGMADVSAVEAQDAANGMKTYDVFPKTGRRIAPGISALARKHNWEIDELHMHQGRLDEVFRDLTLGASHAADPSAGLSLSEREQV